MSQRRKRLLAERLEDRCLLSTLIGSYRVSDGPSWGTNPPVYSGREAAVLLFGGTYGNNPANYSISIGLREATAPICCRVARAMTC